MNHYENFLTAHVLAVTLQQLRFLRILHRCMPFFGSRTTSASRWQFDLPKWGSLQTSLRYSRLGRHHPQLQHPCCLPFFWGKNFDLPETDQQEGTCLRDRAIAARLPTEHPSCFIVFPKSSCGQSCSAMPKACGWVLKEGWWMGCGRDVDGYLAR